MSTQSLPPGFEPGYGTCSEISDLCPVQYTIYGSRFNLGANVFFVVLFGLALIAHVLLGLRFRIWAFSGWFIAAGIMETAGYVARTIMHFNPWSLALVSVQFCGLLWGPTLVSAGISIMFKDMVHYCGIEYSILPPAWIPWIFIGTDILTVILQGIGGIIASVSAGDEGDTSLFEAGENIIIAGVCFQVVHMAVCGIIMLIFMRRYQKAKRAGNHRPMGDKTAYQQDQELNTKVRRNFTWFSRMLAAAFVFIWVRSIYRVPEMAGGWANPIMRDEKSFLVLDSTMVTLAIWILVAFHPGFWFNGAKGNKRSLPLPIPEAKTSVVDSSSQESDGALP